jgi:LCP family protein required for cell wall assembly
MLRPGRNRGRAFADVRRRLSSGRLGPMKRDRDAPTDAPDRGTRRHPVIVAFASFGWPGLGHLVLGHRRLAVILALPQLALVLALVIGAVTDRATVAGWLVTPTVLLGLIVLDLLVLGSRLVALIDAPRRAMSPRPRAATTVVTVALVVVLSGLSLIGHGRAAQLGWTAYDTLTTVFAPTGPRGAAFGGSPTRTASPSPTVASPTATASPQGTAIGETPAPTVPSAPSATPRPPQAWEEDGYLNLLLIGSDAGPGRWKLRTDTMIVLSVDVTDGRAALIGVPRNVRYAPLPPPLDATYPGGFPDLLNALWIWVEENPGAYPGDPAVAPFHALRDTIGLLVGLPIDGMAVIELQGFVRAVDALGGVEVDVPEAIFDARYPDPDGTGNVALSIPAGTQWMDGWHALAYARSRHQDSDYQRMERQQTVLLALQDQLRCQVASHIGDLLLIARDTMWIDLPLTALPDMIRVAVKVDPDSVARLTLTPPRFPVVLDPAGLELIRTAVAELVATAPLPRHDPDEPDRDCPQPVIPDEAL